MYSTCLSRHRTRFACSCCVLLVVLLLAARLAAAQRDEGAVEALARLLAATDARVFDAGLERETLGASDPFVRRQAALAAGRSGDTAAVAPLIAALRDSSAAVQAAAAFALGLLTDGRAVAQIAPPEVIARIRPLLGDRDGHVRVNALRALASFQDSTLVGLALPLVTDRDVNVAVQAETTLGALGGARAAAQLEARLASPRFALRRQAAIALAQADGAAGVAAAAELARDRDWRWRSVATEAFGAARDRARLDLQLTDPDGRVVAQALQALGRIVAEGDTSLAPRARALLAHPDAAVRSVAADLLARHPAPADVDALATAYERAATDTFDDARLSAVAALGAVAATGPEGRAAVASRFVARTPRADDYQVRRLAADTLPEAAARWGPAAPIETGRSLDDYRAVVRRYLVPVV